MKNKNINIEPQDFEMEMTTVWSFKDRGNWATHNGKYRGNFSPYVPRNAILRYSNVGDVVLDQFLGGGTTLVEAKLLNRNAIGIDINDVSIEIAKKNLNFVCKSKSKISILKGDATNLTQIKNESIDLICTHPPYANIIKYSDDIDGDLSRLKYKDFLLKMQEVANESYRVLKKGKFCSILIGDMRKNGKVVPLGFSVMNTFLNANFKLKEIIIKEQHNCKTTGFWKSSSIKYNFLLLAHEYFFVFIKN